MTGGTIADDAELGDHVVTITANDGEYTVMETFIVTVRRFVLSAPLSIQSSGGETVVTPTPVSGQATGGETVVTPTPMPDRSTDGGSGMGMVAASTPSPTPSPIPALASGMALTIGLPPAPGTDLIALPKFIKLLGVDDKALVPISLLGLLLLVLLLIAAFKRRKKSAEKSPGMRNSNVRNPMLRA